MCMWQGSFLMYNLCTPHYYTRTVYSSLLQRVSDAEKKKKKKSEPRRKSRRRFPHPDGPLLTHINRSLFDTYTLIWESIPHLNGPLLAHINRSLLVHINRSLLTHINRSLLCTSVSGGLSPLGGVCCMYMYGVQIWHACLTCMCYFTHMYVLFHSTQHSCAPQRPVYMCHKRHIYMCPKRPISLNAPCVYMYIHIRHVYMYIHIRHVRLLETWLRSVSRYIHV